MLIFFSECLYVDATHVQVFCVNNPFAYLGQYSDVPTACLTRLLSVREHNTSITFHWQNMANFDLISDWPNLFVLILYLAVLIILGKMFYI